MAAAGSVHLAQPSSLLCQVTEEERNKLIDEVSYRLFEEIIVRGSLYEHFRIGIERPLCRQMQGIRFIEQYCDMKALSSDPAACIRQIQDELKEPQEPVSTEKDIKNVWRRLYNQLLNMSQSSLRVIKFEDLPPREMSIEGIRAWMDDPANQRYLDQIGYFSIFDKLTSVPYIVFRLRNLYSLRLRCCCLTELPKALLKLQNLRSLDLHFNRFSSLPYWLKRTGITELILTSNQFEKFPKVIFDMVMLENLDLSDNKLTRFPSKIFNTGVNTLILKGNFITELPDIETPIYILKKLDLSHNRIRCIPPTLVAQAIRLESLNLQYNQITVLPKKELLEAPRLKFLYCEGNDLTEVDEALEKKFSWDDTFNSSLESHMTDIDWEALFP